MSLSTLTNGPRKQDGGGRIESRLETAGGGGKLPPGMGCSPGMYLLFGLNGIICEKSGLAKAFSCESCMERPRGMFGLMIVACVEMSRYPIALT